jgi:hypothetical protein
LSFSRSVSSYSFSWNVEKDGYLKLP